MDEPDESAAYETFQNVIRDLVQPLVGDVKGALNSTLEKQLHDPKGQLAEQGETLESREDARGRRPHTGEAGHTIGRDVG